MKINKQIGWIVAGGILLYSSCSKLDPEVPEVSSYEKKELPIVTITNVNSNLSTTATTASLAWTIVPDDPKRIKKLYFCYKDEISEVLADTNDYRVDLIPLLRNGEDTIRLSGLHSAARFPYCIYVEAFDKAAYIYDSINHYFSTKSNICHEAWTYMASFPGGGADYRKVFSFSTESKGYAGMACGYTYSGAVFDPTFWEFDPLINEWNRKADFPGVARWGYISFAIGKKGYVGLGGIRKEGALTEVLDDFWEYDTETDRWKRLNNFFDPGIDALSFAINGKGYILGGESLSPRFSDMWEYDPITDSWRRRMGISGYVHSKAVVFVLENNAYVLGGYDSDGQPSGILKQYDHKRNVWIRKADFPDAGRVDMYALSFDTMAILGDGYGGKAYDQPMWQYTPSLDQWVEKRNAPCYLPPDYVKFTISGYGYVSHPFVGLLRYDPRVDTE